MSNDGQSALSSKAGSAEIPSGTKGLMEEAKKYKSAEEFVMQMKSSHRPPDINTGSRIDDMTNSY